MNSSTAPDARHAIVTLLLERPLSPPPELIQEALGEAGGGTIVSRHSESVRCDLRGAAGYVTLLPGPLDPRNLEGAGYSSPELEAQVQRHAAQWAVAVEADPADLVASWWRLTRLVARLSLAAGVVAVYWRSAALFHAPAFVGEQVHQGLRERTVPLLIWVQLRIMPRPNQTTDSFSYGLSAFGLPELEAVGLGGGPRETLGLLANLATHLLSRGNTIGEGKAIGRVGQDVLWARRCPSQFGLLGDVLRLAVEKGRPTTG